MEILRPLLCGYLVELPPRSGLRFSIEVREGLKLCWWVAKLETEVEKWTGCYYTQVSNNVD